MEPSAQDVAAVNEALGFSNQPDPQPTPDQAPQPNPQPVQQPEPAPQTDPFQQFYQPTEAPSEPVQPTAQPTEPVAPQPAPQPVQQPVAQPTPQPTPQPVQPAPQTNEYQQLLDEALRGVPELPTAPDASQVNPDDVESVKQFFDDLMVTAEKRFEANFTQKQAVQNLEKRLWEDAFNKYNSLKDNSNLRDMVQAIRMAEFNKGNAMTPTQAAERLLKSLEQQYQQGIADNQVQTTIAQVQPTGGNGTQVSTNYDAEAALEAVQTGGEDALVKILDQRFNQQ